MADTERLEKLCASCKWQVQELKLKRTRTKDTNGSYNYRRRTRLIRKCEFSSKEAAHEMVKYLSTDACLEYLVLCREELNKAAGTGADTKWMPVQAWYAEEDATNQHARKGMLYHVLRQWNDDSEAEGPFVVNDGCKYYEEYTFYWDVNEPPECPESSSGVQYSVDIKRRDDSQDDGFGGLFDCIVTKRVTVEQDVLPYESHEELGETRITAQMLGVSDESENNGDDIDAKVETFAEENALKLEDGPITEDGETVGVVVDLNKEKNADCTTSVTIHNTREEKIEHSEVVGTQTKRSKTLRITDTNVAAETTEADKEYPLVEVGSDGTVTQKTVTKTKGGVRVIQTVTTTPIEIEAGKGNVSESVNLYETQASQEAENIEVVGDGIGTVSDGNTYQRTVKLNDDGTFNVVDVTTTEQEVKESEVVTMENARSTVTRTTDTNVASEGEETEFREGTVIRKTVSKTKGDLRVVTTEETVAKEIDDGDGTVVCEKTVFEHKHTTVAENQDSAEDEADNAGGGKTHKVTSQLNDDGTFNVTTEETQEIENSDYYVSAQGNSHVGSYQNVAIEKNNRSATTSCTGFVAPTSDKKDYALTEKRYTKTPGGWFDVQTTTTTPVTREAVLNFKAETYRTSSSTTMVYIFENKTADEIKALAPNYTGGSARLNSFGLYDGSFSLTTHTQSGDDSSGSTDDEYDPWWTYQAHKDVRVVTMKNNIYTLTEQWNTGKGVLKRSYKQIMDDKELASEYTLSLDATPATRDLEYWGVNVESQHSYSYVSLLNSHTFTAGPDASKLPTYSSVKKG